MDKLFTVSEQLNQLERGKTLFNQTYYAEAELILLLVTESALQTNHYTIYVDAMIWLNRIYINTVRYEMLHQNILAIHPLVTKFASDEERYLYKTHVSLFNSHYSIGDSLTDFTKLLQELSLTPYHDLYYSTMNNLIYAYLEQNRPDEAYQLVIQTDMLQHIDQIQNKLCIYMYMMHSFSAYYAKEQYEKCQQILQRVEQDDQIIIPDSFRLTYDVSKTLLEAQLGDMNKAKKQYDRLFESDPNYFTQLHFHLRLWIRTLEQAGLKDDVIYYQRRIIFLLEHEYSVEIRRLRKESIEYYSKQFYETKMYTDQMTGVKNRNFFEVYVEKLEQVKYFTVVLLDIDQFKLINDTYGHIIGDEALQFVAKQLLQWHPAHDIHIIRYGGDEFIVLIPHPYEHYAQSLMTLHERILTTPLISQKKQHPIPLSISIGICHTNGIITSLEQLFARADEVMYEAKKERGTIRVSQWQPTIEF